ncbi:hypothetical protein T4A_2483 [Trichinella pseudospiralis]|uniref:Uncharacterized protein n=1 Tax=Trichinella pseudospiralis TaxID=6337 RepID=A0A0V1DP58_TRIPS|nr:hypothetical protein T4A_2483 [Trichinella pseudospiralis]
MICRRFSKSSSYTSLFPLNLFKEGNVSVLIYGKKWFADDC